MKSNITITLSSLLLLMSCEFFQVKHDTGENEEDTRKPIARAGTAFLYAEDIESMIPNGKPSADSADWVSRYVDTWLRKQLLIKAATENIEFDEAEIERKILDYRYSLIGYEYQSYYINEKLDSEVTDEEIVAYYNEHIDNFVLKQNIIRGKFINLPKGAPTTIDVTKMLNSNKEEDIETLKNYCLSFATSYQLNDSLWINFEELVRSTPLAQLDNKVQFLKTRTYSETSDSTNMYYLKILEYKMSDEVSPIEFVKDQVRSIIINKRKTALAKQLEQQVYEEAKKNNEIEIYEK